MTKSKTDKAIDAGKDKTSVDQNSKAKPIEYPKGEDVSPVILRERATIKIPLDKDKRLEKAALLCQLIDELNELEDQKKAAASKFAEDIKSKETEIEEVKEQVSKKYEEKEVVCDIIRDFKKGVRIYHYKGVDYHEEPLTSKDHQLDLDVAEKNNKKEKPDSAKLLQIVKYKAGDYVKTVKGIVTKLTEDDLLTLNTSRIEGYASNTEIDAYEAAAKKKK